MTPRLVCATPLPAAVAQRANAEFNAILSQDKEVTIGDLMQALRDRPGVQAVLTSSRVKFDAAAIAALPHQVKILATCSVGTEHIDLAAAATRGLIVTNTPDELTNATADIAFMLRRAVPVNMLKSWIAAGGSASAFPICWGSK